MRFKEDTVPLSAINTNDSTYRITTNTAIEDLGASIKNVGLINPPFLIRISSAYRIVTGFRRINACQSLGWSTIDARVLEPGTEALQCAKLAITDNSFQRSLNLIELSRAISMLKHLVKDTERLTKIASSLGLPDNPSILKKIENLCRLSWPIQQGVILDSLSLAMAIELGKYEQDVAIFIAELFMELKLSLNKQREILTLIKEIAYREGLGIRELLKEKAIKEIINAEDLDRTQKTKKFRLYLKQRRYPEITKAEKNFENGVKNLKLGLGLQLNPPKNFEGKTFTLNLFFDNFDELEDRKAILDKMLKDLNLASILKE
jgi:ParB family chromosome partitioning protein